MFSEASDSFRGFRGVVLFDSSMAAVTVVVGIE
jgi:hypothetical protein